MTGLVDAVLPSEILEDKSGRHTANGLVANSLALVELRHVGLIARECCEPSDWFVTSLNGSMC
jgi:hypothetical protein